MRRAFKQRLGVFSRNIGAIPARRGAPSCGQSTRWRQTTIIPVLQTAMLSALPRGFADIACSVRRIHSLKIGQASAGFVLSLSCRGCPAGAAGAGAQADNTTKTPRHEDVASAFKRQALRGNVRRLARNFADIACSKQRIHALNAGQTLCVLVSLWCPFLAAPAPLAPPARRTGGQHHEKTNTPRHCLSIRGAERVAETSGVLPCVPPLLHFRPAQRG